MVQHLSYRDMLGLVRRSSGLRPRELWLAHCSVPSSSVLTTCYCTDWINESPLVWTFLLLTPGSLTYKEVHTDGWWVVGRQVGTEQSLCPFFTLSWDVEGTRGYIISRPQNHLQLPSLRALGVEKGNKRKNLLHACSLSTWEGIESLEFKASLQNEFNSTWII